MVRIKNRHLLVQILHPNLLAFPASPLANTQTTATPQSSSAQPTAPHHHLLTTLHAPIPDYINPPHVLRLLRAQIQLLYGEHGLASCSPGLAVKYFSNATATFIVRCRREVVRLVWGAVCFVKGLGVLGERAPGGRRGAGKSAAEGEIVMRVVRVSGTMRKCQEEAVRRARGLLGRVRGLEEVRELVGEKWSGGDFLGGEVEEDVDGVGSIGSDGLGDDDGDEDDAMG